VVALLLPPQATSRKLANNNETTYSFISSGGGEDFSQLNSNTVNANMPHIPVYGASRDDPYYIAANNNANHQHQFHSTNNFQDKATMALVQTGETMKSLWNVGISGAQTIGAMAKPMPVTHHPTPAPHHWFHSWKQDELQAHSQCPTPGDYDETRILSFVLIQVN
jgi:hypothetical protein